MQYFELRSMGCWLTPATVAIVSGAWNIDDIMAAGFLGVLNPLNPGFLDFSSSCCVMFPTLERKSSSSVMDGLQGRI